MSTSNLPGPGNSWSKPGTPMCIGQYLVPLPRYATLSSPRVHTMYIEREPSSGTRVHCVPGRASRQKLIFFLRHGRGTGTRAQHNSPNGLKSAG
eukprot:1349470-Rhodomonas_salina.1